jgi:hypothetical protein
MFLRSNHNIPEMNEHVSGKLLLFTSFFLNIGASITKAPHWLEVGLWTVSGIASVLAMFNQFYTFKKNYKTLWIVVKITNVFTFLMPKKKRHRNISISRKKQIK